MEGKGDYEEATSSPKHIYDEIIDQPGNIQLPASRSQHTSGNVQLPCTISQEKVQEKRCGLYILVLLSIIVSAGVSVPVTFFMTKEKYMHNKSWTTWGSWTDCTVTCDTGIQHRHRQLCGNTGMCTNETTDTRTCFQQRCPDFWTTWGSWTDCTVTCGTGIQQRQRQLCRNTGTCTSETNDTRTCFQQRCPAEKFRFSMKFDPSTLYSFWYLSPDNTILSNEYSSLTPNSPDGVNQLKNYKGAIADVCFGDNARIYYEVAYEYTITTTLQNFDLLFDIGLAERGKVDNYYYSGNTNVSGWSFSLYNIEDRNKVYLNAVHLSLYKLRTEFSDNTAGTFKKGTFGVFIDRLKNEFSLVNNGNIFHTFTNIPSSVNFCPVFGVYNSDNADVRLHILNVLNLIGLPFI